MKSRIIKPYTPTPDAVQRMLADCINSLDPSMKPSTERKDTVLARAEDARSRVIAIIRPILAQPGFVWNRETSAKMNLHFAELYGSEFSQWSHEDLVWFMTVVHAERLTGKITEQMGGLQ